MDVSRLCTNPRVVFRAYESPNIEEGVTSGLSCNADTVREGSGKTVHAYAEDGESWYSCCRCPRYRHLAILGVDIAIIDVYIVILGVDIAILGVDIAILGVNIAILGVDIAILCIDIAILGVDIVMLGVDIVILRRK